MSPLPDGHGNNHVMEGEVEILVLADTEQQYHVEDDDESGEGTEINPQLVSDGAVDVTCSLRPRATPRTRVTPPLVTFVYHVTLTHLNLNSGSFDNLTNSLLIRY